jgi:hypothetical protein
MVTLSPQLAVGRELLERLHQMPSVLWESVTDGSLRKDCVENTTRESTTMVPQIEHEKNFGMETVSSTVAMCILKLMGKSNWNIDTWWRSTSVGDFYRRRTCTIATGSKLTTDFRILSCGPLLNHMAKECPIS